MSHYKRNIVTNSIWQCKVKNVIFCFFDLNCWCLEIYYYFCKD